MLHCIYEAPNSEMVKKEKPQSLLKLCFTNQTNHNEFHVNLKRSVRMRSASVSWLIHVNPFDFRLIQTPCCALQFARDHCPLAPCSLQSRLTSVQSTFLRSTHVVAQGHTPLFLFPQLQALFFILSVDLTFSVRSTLRHNVDHAPSLEVCNSH
jgi:hypothetical protein